MQFNEALDCREQAIAQAALVRATGTGGNQIDVALAHRLAVFGKRHTPRSTFAFGKVVALAVRKTFTFKQRNHRVAMERLHQVIAQTRLVEPVLSFLGFFLDQRHADARHEHRLAAQQVDQLTHGQGGRFKVFGVRPDAHRGAGFAVTLACLADLQRFGDVTALKHNARHRTFTVTGGFQPFAQCVGDAHAHAVQTTGEAVGAALALVELATGMQTGKYQFNHRRLFFRMQSEWNAPAIVLDRHRTVGVQGHLDFFAMAGQRLISGVVQHFLNHVQRVVGAGVHARALLDGLQALENANRTFRIFGSGFGCHRPPL
ncbi:MAG: hypothetical protein RL081_1406 [Pseudomonadota bacterium]